MRWKYLVPRLLLALLCWAFFYCAFDPLLRRAATAAGQAALGARVEIAALDTTFFPPSFALRHVQLADAQRPETNLLQFDTARVRLAGEPLLHRSFVVQDATLTGVRWGARRASSGALKTSRTDGKKANQPGTLSKAIDALGATADDLKDDWLDDLTARAMAQLDPNQFESVRLGRDTYVSWQREFETQQARIKSIEARIKRIEQTVKTARDSDGPVLEKIETYNQARLEVRELLLEAERLRNELPMLGMQAAQDYQQIDEARLRDLQNLRQRIETLRFDGQAIADALIGAEIRSKLAATLDWIQWGRRKLEVIMQDGEPSRSRGVDIELARRIPAPAFLLQQLKLTGEAEFDGHSLPFRALVTGVTTHPRLHRKPVVIQMAAGQDAALQMESTLDWTGPTPRYALNLDYTRPHVVERSLGRAEKMSLAMTAGQTVWQARVRLVGDELDGRLVWRQQPVSIIADVNPQVRPEITRVVQRAFSEIDRLEAAVVLSGSWSEPEWKIESDLGRQVADRVGDLLLTELSLRREELALEVDRLANEKLAAFEELARARLTTLTAQLQRHEQAAQQIVQNVAGKAGLDAELLNAAGLGQFEALPGGLDKAAPSIFEKLTDPPGEPPQPTKEAMNKLKRLFQ